MAFRFGKKPPSNGNGESGKEPEKFEPQPDKARKWFEHARAAKDSYNYKYALHLYASGLRLDPESMSMHEAMYEAAIQYFNKAGKSASGREIKDIEGPHPVEKFVAAEFAWMKDINNASLALKLLEATTKAEQYEVGHWLAPKILNILNKQKKPSKNAFLQAKEYLAEIGAWDEAIRAGEVALFLDPNDNELESELKDLSAQRAMDQGRYAEQDEDGGGFRKFVLDADKQRELEEGESISAGKSIEQRNLARAKKEYEESPTIPDVINKYAQLVKAKGTTEDEQYAYDLYIKGYAETNEYRFRALAGDIKIEQAQREVDSLTEKAALNSSDTSNNELLKVKLDALHALKLSEYTERTVKYPTDRTIKFSLGEVEFDLERFMDAMKRFQEAKDEPRLRVKAEYMLGRCFSKEHWHIEAIEVYKQALSHIEVSNKDMELAIRYDLMISLMDNARDDESLELAKESREICTSIVQADVTYRDIRSYRKSVDQLIRQLSGRSTGD